MTELPTQKRVFNYSVTSPSGFYMPNGSLTRVIYGFSSAEEKTSGFDVTHIFIRDKETGYIKDIPETGTSFYFSTSDYDKDDVITFERKNNDLIVTINTPRNLSCNTYVFCNQFAEDKMPALDYINMSYKDEKGEKCIKNIDMRDYSECAVYELNSALEAYRRDDIKPDFSRSRVNVHENAIDNISYNLDPKKSVVVEVKPSFTANRNVVEQFFSPKGRELADSYVLDLRRTERDGAIYAPLYGPDAHADYDKMLRVAVESVKDNSRFVFEVPRQFVDKPAMEKLTILTLDENGATRQTNIEGDSLKSREGFIKAFDKAIEEAGYGVRNPPALTQQLEHVRIEEIAR